MRSIHKRLPLAALISALLLCAAGTGVMAGLTLTCTPNEATANSVWNFTATWTANVWPTGSPGTAAGTTEGLTYDENYVVASGAHAPSAVGPERSTSDSWLMAYPYFLGFGPPSPFTAQDEYYYGH